MHGLIALLGPSYQRLQKPYTTSAYFPREYAKTVIWQENIPLFNCLYGLLMLIIYTSWVASICEKTDNGANEKIKNNIMDPEVYMTQRNDNLVVLHIDVSQTGV